MTPERARRLPWTGPEGKPCYVLGDGTGPLSRVADQIEAVQLGLARNLVTHALGTLDDPEVEYADLQTLAAHLTEALHDALLIAAGRGTRLRP
ncbi:hypothetical protein [Streptomyces beijiangensis]|uniref:Uncharacterized protein n=1 Tax=Streptomyces beijiangensis TaxID=163361 RepID=A0A939JLS4_9ACTN|nr:hypothetical protein [Streptomyces beijiangensis]MBO0516034.1 hypothetical protein [Streptomyces beijiangensis]